MSEHTPEKWNYDERIACVSVYAGEPRNCLADDVGEIYYRDHPTAEDLANARLIAAAPDLLAACEDVFTLLDMSYRVSPERLAKAKNILLRAVAKAKGAGD